MSRRKKRIENDFLFKKRRILNVRDFVSIPDLDRRSVLRNLTDEQYDDIMRVCACYPVIDMKVNIKGRGRLRPSISFQRRRLMIQPRKELMFQTKNLYK